MENNNEIEIKSFSTKPDAYKASYLKGVEIFSVSSEYSPYDILLQGMGKLRPILARTLDLDVSKIYTTGWECGESDDGDFWRIYGTYKGTTGVSLKIQTPKLLEASDAVVAKIFNVEKKREDYPFCIFDDELAEIRILNQHAVDFVKGGRQRDKEQLELFTDDDYNKSDNKESSESDFGF